MSKQRSPPLKLVVTSATLDGEKFSSYFDECPVLRIPGRCFPVSVAYAVEVPASYQEEVVNLALDIHCDHPSGDVLIFMTGQVRRASWRQHPSVAHE